MPYLQAQLFYNSLSCQEKNKKKQKMHHPPSDWATPNYHVGVVKPLDLVVMATLS